MFPCLSASATTNVEPDQESNHPRAIIDEVRFDTPIHLPQSVVDEAIAQVKGGFDAKNARWLNEFLEIGIRGAWQDRGYFRVVVGQGKAELLGGVSSEQHFRVLVHIDEGLQYHLGDIIFENAKAFSPGELRGLVPLEAGEMFDISKIRLAIELLMKKYDANGYIDFTAVPEPQVDDKLQRIVLVLSLDEQKQYRIGTVNVTGFDATLEAALRTKFVPGDVYNPVVIDDFVKANRESLPADLRQQDYIHATRNTRLGIVDLSFDFRPLDSRGCGAPERSDAAQGSDPAD
jgi:hypothetical protein